MPKDRRMCMCVLHSLVFVECLHPSVAGGCTWRMLQLYAAISYITKFPNSSLAFGILNFVAFVTSWPVSIDIRINAEHSGLNSGKNRRARHPHRDRQAFLCAVHWCVSCWFGALSLIRCFSPNFYQQHTTHAKVCLAIYEFGKIILGDRVCVRDMEHWFEFFHVSLSLFFRKKLLFFFSGSFPSVGHLIVVKAWNVRKTWNWDMQCQRSSRQVSNIIVPRLSILSRVLQIFVACQHVHEFLTNMFLIYILIKTVSYRTNYPIRNSLPCSFKCCVFTSVIGGEWARASESAAPGVISWETYQGAILYNCNQLCTFYFILFYSFSM